MCLARPSGRGRPGPGRWPRGRPLRQFRSRVSTLPRDWRHSRSLRWLSNCARRRRLRFPPRRRAAIAPRIEAVGDERAATGARSGTAAKASPALFPWADPSGYGPPDQSARQQFALYFFGKIPVPVMGPLAVCCWSPLVVIWISSHLQPAPAKLPSPSWPATVPAGSRECLNEAGARSFWELHCFSALRRLRSFNAGVRVAASAGLQPLQVLLRHHEPATYQVLNGFFNRDVQVDGLALQYRQR